MNTKPYFWMSEAKFETFEESTPSNINTIKMV